MNTPQAITKSEWERIVKIPTVRKVWGIRKSETAASFSQRVLGVKFEQPTIFFSVDTIYILADGDASSIRTMLYRYGKQLWAANTEHLIAPHSKNKN